MERNRGEGETPLPHPTEFPDRNILIYDGECRFCISQVSKLARWDVEGELAFTPLQDAFVAEQYPELSREMLMKEMYLVTRDDQRFGGVHAVREIARRLPKLRWLSFWFRVPLAMTLSRMAYRTIARWRYKIWGRVNRCDHGTCDLHF